MDTRRPRLWKIENFLAFLQVRKSLLAKEVNIRMEELLHGETRWLEGPKVEAPVTETSVTVLPARRKNNNWKP